MLTSARIRDELRPAHMDWTARGAPTRSGSWSTAGRCSCRCRRAEPVEITHPDTAERLVCCHNPALADERARNATSCWRPPKTTQTTPRPPAANAGRCAAQTPSPCGWARCATSSKWPNTSPRHHQAFTFTRNQEAPSGGGRRPRATLWPDHTLGRDESSCATKTSPTSTPRTLNTDSTCGRPARLADRVRAHMLRMLSYDEGMKHALAPTCHRQRQTRRRRQTRRPRRARPTLRPSAQQGSAQTHPR